MYRCLKWIEVKLWLYEEVFKINNDDLLKLKILKNKLISLIFFMVGYNFIEILLDCVLNDFFSKII